VELDCVLVTIHVGVSQGFVCARCSCAAMVAVFRSCGLVLLGNLFWFGFILVLVTMHGSVS